MGLAKSSKRPGPPKAFDADAALDKAMQVFWRKGFDGTSIADLTRAMAINRPSLYATFGNKLQLFRRALARYGDQGRPIFIQCQRETTPRRFVEALLRSMVDRYTDPSQPAGCFFIQSAIASGNSSKAAREETRRRRLMNQATVRKYLSRRDFQRQLPRGFTAGQLAAYLASIANGIALRAADGADRRELNRVVDLALAFWPAEPSAETRTSSNRTAFKQRGSPQRRISR